MIRRNDPHRPQILSSERCIAPVGVVAGILVCLTSLPLAVAQDQWFATTEPRTPAQEQRRLHVPPGFAVELVAAEPDIAKPLNMNFDERGRLWVTSTVEYPLPAPPERKPRDTVKILEDSDGNGTFDKLTTFADGLNIPIGVLPVSVVRADGQRVQGAIVYSIPNIYLLSDEDGDGQADRRDMLYGTFGTDDTHGMTGSFTRGFDGWIYAHHGFANTSHVTAADGSSIGMHSGNTFRFRADGSRLEQHTWGQVNPFGLCFDQLGNLFAADCHTRPAYLLLRGGYYPSFGKPHDGLGFAPELMTHDHGSTAISGITYYAADQFPTEYHGSLLIGNVVTNRINRDTLARSGSTYHAIEQPDFVVSDDPWFRPVDIQLGPDGALYVADFYNRVIAHVEVPLTHPGRDRERGRIWRIFWKGMGGDQVLPPIPDFTVMDLPELAGKLGSRNLTVRLLASQELVHRDRDNVEALLLPLLDQGADAHARLHAMWVLERLGLLSDENLWKRTEDSDAQVRTHALKVLAERNEWPVRLAGRARAALGDADGLVRRAAADALGRHPSPDNFQALLDARSRIPASDALLLHTVRMALRDQLRSVESWEVLTGDLSEARARWVADVALGVQSVEAAGYLLRFLQHYKDDLAATVRYIHHVTRYGRQDQMPDLLVLVRGVEDTRREAALFRALVEGTQERGGSLSPEARILAESLVDELLASDKAELLTIGIDLTEMCGIETAQEELAELATRRDFPESQRSSALSVLVSIDPQQHVKLLCSLLCDPGDFPGIRDQAALTLAAVDHPAAREALWETLPTAPARLQRAIAVGLATDSSGAETLLAAVAAGKASARLLQQREVKLRLEQSGLPYLKERLATLTAGLPPEDERLQQLLDERRDHVTSGYPDAANGAKVFAKHCGICHQVENEGAQIGPQLDGIGMRGLDRLLEDVMDPHLNVDQAFRATMLVLNDGKVVTGQVLREEGQVLILADQQGKEIRVPRREIEEREVLQLSLMPANVVEQIPETDFRDLMGYLLTLNVQVAGQ